MGNLDLQSWTCIGTMNRLVLVLVLVLDVLELLGPNHRGRERGRCGATSFLVHGKAATIPELRIPALNHCALPGGSWETSTSNPGRASGP